MSDLITQPALYSIINVPSDAFKSKFSGGGSGQGQRYSHEQEYIKTCSKLFQACGSETTTTTFETLLETVVYCLSHLLFVLVAGVGVDVGEGQGQDEVVYSQEVRSIVRRRMLYRVESLTTTTDFSQHDEFIRSPIFDSISFPPSYQSPLSGLR